MNRSQTVFWLFLAVLAVPEIANAGPDSFLVPLGPVAEAQRTHLIRVVVITMIAIIPVLVGVPLIIWRYRRRADEGRYRPEPLYRPDWKFSGPLEIAMWGVPFCIIAVLGWWLWHETETLDPYTARGPVPLKIQAIGLDWKWLFLYPEQGFATLGEIAVPLDRPVRIALTSDTVMQSFRVSALAGQIYVMPGMQTELNFTATRPGTARGENTQFSGDGFSEQKFTLRALDHEAWLAWVAAPGVMPLDTATYDQLGRRATPDQTAAMLGVAPGPIRFSDIPPNLFSRVIARYHSGKAVAPQDQPGSPAYAQEERP